MADKWIEVTGKKCNKVKTCITSSTTFTNTNPYVTLSTSDPIEPKPPQALAAKTNKPSKTNVQPKSPRRRHVEHILRQLAQQESAFLDRSIARAEQERTDMAKKDPNNPARRAIEAHEYKQQNKPSIFQQGRNISYGISSFISRATKQFNKNEKHVTFAANRTVRTFLPDDNSVMITYDSGADGHYISEQDRIAAGMPILRPSTKRVGVANGGTSQAKHVTALPFKQLSTQATRADSFDDFPHSLMSAGRTADDGTISIFTKDGVTVHKEQDVLIKCQGQPIFIGVRDEHGRYRIPLMQQRGQWQPRKPSKRARQVLEKANSVYDLPSIEQAIKWMHAVCGYPVKSTWLKAIKAGNFVGWPLLNEKNVNKYYPDTDETQKGHMTQTRKNVRSTKGAKAALAFEICNAAARLRGKKEEDIFISTYNVRETIFSDQTGQYPLRSQRGNKYIMVMVEIDSNAILVEPMKSMEDKEMIRAYDTLVKRLTDAGIQPKKHVLDNEVSNNMKQHIKKHHKFQMELVPPGCHRRNAAEVAIRNFKSHFLSVMAGTAASFPGNLWDRLLPQTEITLNLLRQSNSTPHISAYAHINISGPFDYNKMPLAPMGCEVQVHEKTDKRGTWAFHSVDGWYLNTSNEHYRVHNCHIKSTKSERLSDTVHLKHKNITNPEITPLDKLMNAIANCKAAIAQVNTGQANQQMQDLEAVVKQAEKVVLPRVQKESNRSSQESSQRMQTLPVPRVQEEIEVCTTPSGTRIQTRATVQRQAIAAQQLQAQKQRNRRPKANHMTSQVNLPNQPPALSTRSRTTAARQKTAPAASNTRSKAHCRVSRLRQPTRSSIGKTKHQALFVESQNTRKFLRQFSQVEQEVHQAMAVMDRTTGKMLNY